MAKKCCGKWKKKGKCCSSCPIAKKMAKLEDHKSVKVKKSKKKDKKKSDKKSVKKSDKKSDKKKSKKKK